jgi:small subunit ribosomal protein S7e
VLAWVANCARLPQLNNAHIKKDLQALHISAARQVEVAGGRQAIIVFVPYKLLKGFRKIQKILVEELEKRFR